MQAAEVFGRGGRTPLGLRGVLDPRGAPGTAASRTRRQVDPAGAQPADDAFHRGLGDADLGGYLGGGEIVAPESRDRRLVGMEVMASAAPRGRGGALIGCLPDHPAQQELGGHLEGTGHRP